VFVIKRQDKFKQRLQLEIIVENNYDHYYNWNTYYLNVVIAVVGRQESIETAYCDTQA